ncbi:MAG TPA: 1-(5-phosphoribosyl)-5-((5-phosphoribosylamino)methylideneamino)imidazole-4-carboxamide isomerase, partial [Actinobacteria bacterium]|nr:1-(5-phosphoribosyl)-5-((5-phosphoribosylamino)methylideneamino)imidazole-4-carboxamide isomerase [Actinomycetota bacterium]
MEIIPAIDIIDGKCVRLFQGDYEKVSHYPYTPVEIAARWKDMGAKWIHLIDLDGAKKGKPVNLETAELIKKKINIRLEYGGGIRTLKDVESLVGIGIDRLIISTKALENFDFIREAGNLSGNKIIISLDFNSEGIILKKGWLQQSEYNVIDFGKRIFQSGIKEVIITDISRDGTLEGVNRKIIKDFAESTGLSVYIAGGINRI